MKILGAWSGHDCSYCILEDGYPVVHAEYERHIREKEPAGDGLQFFFDDCEDVDDIKYFVTSHSFEKTLAHKESFNRISQIVEKNKGGIHVFGHHQCHAANAFFSSNLDESLIITMDGGGVEDKNGFVSAFTVWQGKGNKIHPLSIFPLNEIDIGGVWTRVTRYVYQMQSGWPYGHQAGTIMAMAAFGDSSKYVDDFYRMLTTDLQYAHVRAPGQPRGAVIPGKDPKHPYLHRWTEIASRGEQEKFDLAAGLQLATEIYMKELFGAILKKVGNVKNICFSGGVALNSVAMGKVKGWFPELEEIYVTPTPHDGGLTIGAAQFLWHQVLDKPRIEWKDNFSPFLGSQYELGNILDDYSDRVDYEVATDDQVLDLLEQQNIVAVFGGGSESGRRALGNRSILADPRSPKMKDFINDKVKHRQWYRPFAPSILDDKVADWFTEYQSSPYMNFVLRFKDEVADKVPAVVHKDNSARLQTVTENDNPWYYNFIKKWDDRTGVPILLNTSFNDREPICEIPQHALECYLKTEIDYLYFYDFKTLIRRKSK